MPLDRGFFIPLPRFGIVLCDTLPVGIEEAELVLRDGLSLLFKSAHAGAVRQTIDRTRAMDSRSDMVPRVAASLFICLSVSTPAPASAPRQSGLASSAW